MLLSYFVLLYIHLVYACICVCIVFAPTAIDAHANETMTFYDRLSSIVDAIPSRDHLFLCGDFNATLPVDKVRVKNRCGEANRNTKMLQSFIEHHDLLAANAYTRQKHRSLPTFDGPNGRKTRLDWILCCCCCCCRPHSTNVLPAESSTRIMWQPTVSPPRWQGKAPLCRDSSRGPG